MGKQKYGRNSAIINYKGGWNWYCMVPIPPANANITTKVSGILNADAGADVLSALLLKEQAFKTGEPNHTWNRPRL